MIRRFPRLAPLVLLAAGAGWYGQAQLAPGERGVAPIDSSSNLEVTGVRVDVAAPTADQARTAGWREAQRRAWKTLWARAHGASPDAAPGLPDGTLDGIVAGIEVENEEIGPHRYIASLGVLFDRSRVGQYLGGSGQGPRSQPMLVIPVMFGQGTEFSFEWRTPWQKAWARFRAGASPIDYVRPVGTGSDPLLLNFGQTRRPGRIWWRMLLDQYAASDVVVPEVYLRRRWPGGPVWARFVALHGPDAEELGSFTLTAPDGESVPAMLDEGVKRLDALYVAALGQGRLGPDPSLTIEEPEAPAETDLIAGDADDPLAGVIDQAINAYSFQVDTPDAGAVDQALAALKTVPGMSSASVVSLAIGGASLLSGSFAGDPSALRLALSARGWRMEGDGFALRLRRATPAAAPPPAP